MQRFYVILNSYKIWPSSGKSYFKYKKKKKKERKKEAIHVTFRVQLSGCTLHDQCHSNTNEQVVLNTHFYHANVLKIFLNSNWQSPKLRFLLQPMKSLTQIIQTT